MLWSSGGGKFSRYSFLAKVIGSGAVNQIIMAGVGIIRVPVVIVSFGPELFASYSAALGFWTLIAAIGESARQRVRIVTFSGPRLADYRKILIQSLVAASLVAILCFIIFLAFDKNSAPDSLTFLTAMIAGVTYIPFAMGIGRLEGQYRLASANLLFSVGQVLGLLLTFCACQLQAIWLVAVSVLVPFFIPGLCFFFVYLTTNLTHGQNLIAKERSVKKESQRPLLLLVLFAETIVYAVDGAIILKLAGHEEAASFAITSRISAIFAVLPIIMAPLSSSLDLGSEKGVSARQISLLQKSVGLGLWSGILIFGELFFNSLAHNKVQFSFFTLLAASTSGLILTLTTTEIQRAVSSDLIRVRAIATPLVAILNLSLTATLCPFLGATASFLSTGLGQLIYFLVVRRHRRRFL